MLEIALSPALDVVSVWRRDSDVDVKPAAIARRVLSSEDDNVRSETFIATMDLSGTVCLSADNL
jgi:hypothetical protein